MTSREQPERLERIHEGALVNWMAGPPAWHRPILRGTPYLTVREAAARSGVSEARLEGLIARGACPNARKRWGSGASEPWMIPVIDLVALDILPHRRLQEMERLRATRRGDRDRQLDSGDGERPHRRHRD